MPENNEDDDHRHQDREVADPFAKHVKRTGQRCGCHDLPDARFAVARHRAFDEIKTEPADERMWQ